jgi:SAM-dependent MidA family methyltransferase
MGSSPDSPTAVSPEFLAVFREHADAGGEMSFARFMELALYHPGVGYYRKHKKRVGYAAGTDFFTSSTSGAIFGELVAAACAKLLRAAGRDPASHTFIEIGAEHGGGVLAGVAHPFAGARTIGVGSTIELEGECIVFSNELFDAQPFTPTVFRDGRWHEVLVHLEGGRLTETLRPQVLRPCESAQPLPEGYRFDEPEAATALARLMAAQPWSGLFVAIDYGKASRELLLHTPQGTARAYYRHTQSNDLLARPGEQDLTCHICWDWISDALRAGGFAPPVLDSQEAFFIRHAGEFIAPTIAAEAARLSPRKLALMQLLHPSHLGQKFQAMHALR